MKERQLELDDMEFVISPACGENIRSHPEYFTLLSFDPTLEMILKSKVGHNAVFRVKSMQALQNKDESIDSTEAVYLADVQSCEYTKAVHIRPQDFAHHVGAEKSINDIPSEFFDSPVFIMRFNLKEYNLRGLFE